VQVVLVGHMNPAIFHPTWFAAQDIFSHPEAEHAEIQVIHPQHTAFSTDRFRIQVQVDRFTAEAVDPKNHEPLRDVVLGTFNALHHTPIRLMGLNLNSHFQMRDRAALNELGFKLAPKDPWAAIGLDAAMLGLAMQVNRDDEYKGHQQIRVEPSVKVRDGVFIQVNDHYDFGAAGEPLSAESALTALETAWGGSLRHARKISRKLLES
jgi:hypothetical protein